MQTAHVPRPDFWPSQADDLPGEPKAAPLSWADHHLMKAGRRLHRRTRTPCLSGNTLEEDKPWTESSMDRSCGERLDRSLASDRCGGGNWLTHRPQGAGILPADGEKDPNRDRRRPRETRAPVGQKTSLTHLAAGISRFRVAVSSVACATTFFWNSSACRL